MCKKILGDNASETTMYVRMFGPLNQVKWTWEIDSVDQEMENPVSYTHLTLPTKPSV